MGPARGTSRARLPTTRTPRRRTPRAARGRAAVQLPGIDAGRRRHLAVPVRRSHPRDGHRRLPRHEPGRRRVQGGAAHPQPDAEPAGRGRAVGVVHPGLRPPAGRGPRRRGGPPGRRHRGVADRAHRRHQPGRRPVRRTADHDPRPGVRRREARPHGRADPHHVPRHRVPRAVGVVPRRAQQPPPVLPVLRGTGACGTSPRSRRWWSASSSSAVTTPRSRRATSPSTWPSAC